MIIRQYSISEFYLSIYLSGHEHKISVLSNLCLIDKPNTNTNINSQKHSGQL